MERLCRPILHIRDEEGAPRLARCYVWSSGERPKVGEGDPDNNRCPGVFFGSTIQVFIPLDVPVQVEVYHGFNWSVWRKTFQTAEEELEMTVTLQRFWEHPRWVCGESHSHIARGEGNLGRSGSFSWVRTLCLADGLDYYQPGYPWPGYSPQDNEAVDLSRVKEKLERLSDEALLLAPGCEFPKTRFGHLCWVNLEGIRLTVAECFDASWEDWLFNSRPGQTPRDFPYGLLSLAEIIAKHRQGREFCFFAHPTSWWWYGDKFVPNIAAELPYLTMAGPLYDGLVVMGYQADHLYYQNLWFHLLNLGYRITGVAEVDAVWGRKDFDLPGKYRNYTFSSKRTMEEIALGLRQGRNLVTSGPFVGLSANGRHLPGDLIPEGDYEFSITCWASGDPQERLSYVVLYRNGRPFRVWDLRSKIVRYFEEKVTVREDSPAWYLVKCYGSEAPEEATLDLMRFLPEHPGYIPKRVSQVALTNPIYIRPVGHPSPQAYSAKVRGFVTDRHERPLSGWVWILDPVDQESRREQFTSGEFCIQVPLTAYVEVQVDGYVSQRRSVRFDCPALVETIESVYMGKFNQERRWAPGQLLFEHLGWDVIEKALGEITWLFRLEEG